MDDQDVYFLNFFHQVIKDDLERDTRFGHKDFLRKVQVNQWESQRLCHTSSALRSAYIYYYAPCLASSLYSHFAELVKDNTFLLRRITLRQSFTVCCFCSGLTVDFLALTALLDAMLRDCCPASDYGTGRIHIEFVIVGMDPGWTGLVEKMAKKLSHELGASRSLLSLNLRVIKADGRMPMTDEVKGVLNQSDLVTVVHFLSSVCDSERTSRLDIIKAIVRYIPGGGVLFFLDTPSDGIHNTLEENLESCDESLVEIYGPLKYSVHRMRLLCRKECIRLYSKMYGWRCCALESTLYAHAWYKRTHLHM